MTKTITALADPTEVVNSFLKSGCTAVTFDVFDTLIWRETLRPHEAFFMLADNQEKIAATARKYAELVVTAFYRRVLRKEPTLADFYRLLPLSIDREVSTELRICIANPFCLGLVRELLSKDIPVAAISDMYLSSEQISGMLERVGYPKIPLFSSATEQVSKFGNGLLFHRAWTDLNIISRHAIHVGDNPETDFAMAQRLGANACRIVTPRETLFTVLPWLNREMSNSEESVFWGKVAIHLQLHIANDPLKLDQARKVLSTLIKEWDIDTPVGKSAFMSAISVALPSKLFVSGN